MRLHRAEAAEWDGLAPRQLNLWQRLAARSHGLATPGNIISLAGGLIVAYGLYDIAYGRLLSGIVFVLLGRGADVLDGIVAEATATKSPLGEAFDATMDKILLGMTLLVLLSDNLLPWVVGGFMVLQGLYNSVIAIISRRRPIKLHPSQTGKLSAVFEWLSVALYVLGAHFKNRGNSDHALLVAAGLSFAIFVIMSGLSSIDYSRQFRKQARQR